MSEYKIPSFRGRLAFLSNFFQCSIAIGNYRFSNAESAFQSMKCIRNSDKIQFCRLSPIDAKKLGRKIPIRSDWNQIRIESMKKVLVAKFNQNPDLAFLLKEIDDSELVERNCWNDRFWGVDENGIGKNWLGTLLKEVKYS